MQVGKEKIKIFLLEGDIIFTWENQKTVRTDTFGKSDQVIG